MASEVSTHYDDNELIALIQFHSVDILVGGISSAVCALTLLVFLSSKQFLLHNKLLALLAGADLCTSVGILALGLLRRALYERVMETSRVPLETSWSCAGKPFVYLRLVGALVPPGVVLWISIERLLAVFSPMLYRRHISRNSHIPPLAILVYTGISLLVAYSIAWLNRNNPRPVEAYCGRKNAFTKTYTTYVYLADILGFVFALLINCVTLCHLGQMYTQRQNRFEVKKQLRRINYLLVISFVSTLTVAIPNGISLTSAFFGRLNIGISDPANWMIAAKCSINLFVYLLLKAEFRQRVYEMLGCLSAEQDNRQNEAVSALSGAGAGPRMNGVSLSPMEQWSQRVQARDSIAALADLMADKRQLQTRRRSSNPERLGTAHTLAVPGEGEPHQGSQSVRRSWTNSTQSRISESP